MLYSTKIKEIDFVLLDLQNTGTYICTENSASPNTGALSGKFPVSTLNPPHSLTYGVAIVCKGCLGNVIVTLEPTADYHNTCF